MSDMEGTEDKKVRKRSPRPTRMGTVTSAKADKTLRVVVDFSTKHPLYGKYIRRRTVLHAHDEKNEAKAGDRVEVMSCRPKSKTKRWRLVRILESTGATRR